MFKQIVQEIITSGLSEMEIASKLNSTQPTINRIRNGKQTPMGDLAVGLIDLRKSREKQFRAAIKKAA